jgi:hypothetical protein
MRLVGIAQVDRECGPVDVVGTSRLLRGVVQAIPTDHPLRTDADVIGEATLQLPDTQAGSICQLIDPTDGPVSRDELGQLGGFLRRLPCRRYVCRESIVSEDDQLLVGHVVA